ncbi:AraC family transcriptional regulator [Secundilactobacillus paracollinoides]|uniref:AraC family transcriptional regulator n=1 Tax=Secundilactobacillus paracollinoides TaxID=240427 RepID=UPI001CDAA75F|nr:AraC family transcriptional regulator [Secundilactobacillus paracollinoides]
MTNSPNRAFVLQIPLSFFAQYYQHPETLNFRINPSNSVRYQQIVASFLKLNDIVLAHREGYRFDMGVQLLTMLKILILNFTDADEPLTKDTSGIKEIIVYINGHYAMPLQVETLARQFGYNASYLSRLFKSQTGVTLIRYIYNIRLNVFYQDLIKSGTPIDKLYAKHGLTNKRTARQLFSDQYGSLPNEVRRRAQQKRTTVQDGL